MGFYSIYKIIKDIIRTLFGNKFLKILIIAIIFFTIVFFYCEKSYCASNVGDYPAIHNDTFNSLVKEYTNYFVVAFDGGDLLAFFTNGSFYCITTKPTSGSIYSSDISYVYYYANDGTDWVQTPYSPVNPDKILTTTSFDNVIASSSDILDKNGIVVIPANPAQPPYINPTLGNSQSDLENLNFSNFIINANSYTDEIENSDGTLYMLFYNKSLDKTTVDYLYPIKEKGFTKGSIYTDYENSTSDNMVFSFPLFMSGVFFNVGSTYQIRFAKQNYNAEYGIMIYEYLGDPYTFTISSNVTQDYINQLNQQTASSSDSESTQELQSSINQQTQSINDINNSINDSSVDNSSVNLPTDNTNDPTQSAVDNIFQTIYNSFTSGTAQDIVFPIPYTDKNITLRANYTYTMLHNSNATWIIDIIQAFYWYLISRYIIVDIMQKIRKIKQGDLDEIQNSNIKEDML